MKNDSVETWGLTYVNCVNFQLMWITVFCRCLYVFLYKRLFPKLKALMQHIYVKGTNMSAVPYPVLGTVMFPVRGWMLLFLNSACIIGTLRCSTVRRHKDNQWAFRLHPEVALRYIIHQLTKYPACLYLPGCCNEKPLCAFDQMRKLQKLMINMFLKQ